MGLIANRLTIRLCYKFNRLIHSDARFGSPAHSLTSRLSSTLGLASPFDSLAAVPLLLVRLAGDGEAIGMSQWVHRSHLTAQFDL
jgi:hypothetical protein